ncbi:hypothetical protein QFC21_004224 [Naganishia friedmannii]|uniref:Uncharacterized protein n=1 Tax=Naganishia friedmannii TaxID=89922 RepID=A0ACC2VJM2_9TREE|nr:hypothetical protein QFC21_004224 [Naganishia friedmannii]
MQAVFEMTGRNSLKFGKFVIDEGNRHKKKPLFISQVAQKWNAMDPTLKEEFKETAVAKTNKIKSDKVAKMPPAAVLKEVKQYEGGLRNTVSEYLHVIWRELTRSVLVPQTVTLSRHDVEIISFVVPNYKCQIPGYNGTIIASSPILQKLFHDQLVKNDQGEEEGEAADIQMRQQESLKTTVRGTFHKTLRNIVDLESKAVRQPYVHLILSNDSK